MSNKIDLTTEGNSAVEQAKQMLSGVDIEGASKVRVVVEEENGDSDIDADGDESDQQSDQVPVEGGSGN